MDTRKLTEVKGMFIVWIVVIAMQAYTYVQTNLYTLIMGIFFCIPMIWQKKGGGEEKKGISLWLSN